MNKTVGLRHLLQKLIVFSKVNRLQMYKSKQIMNAGAKCVFVVVHSRSCVVTLLPETMPKVIVNQYCSTGEREGWLNFTLETDVSVQSIVL